MAVLLANAFSIQMLKNFPARVLVEEVSASEVAEGIAGGFESAIGHADTAAVVSSILGADVPAQRANIALNAGDVLYVAQLVGGRLPEGSTTLPEGFQLKFFKVTLA